MLSCSVMFDSVRSHGQQPTRLLCPWDSPGKNTGVGCHFLLRSISIKRQSIFTSPGLGKEASKETEKGYRYKYLSSKISVLCPEQIPDLPNFTPKQDTMPT